MVLNNDEFTQFSFSNEPEKKSTASKKWYTDRTVDLHSTTNSDGSTVQDFNGHCLRRALDRKVNSLRKILTDNEDFTTQINRIVCRLIKLTLRRSRGRTKPLSTRWMEYKLLDLLTLAEKNIKQHKSHFIENYPLDAIHLDYEGSAQMNAIEKIRNDDAGKDIVDKYSHPGDQDGPAYMECMETDLEDKLSIPSTTEVLKDYRSLGASLVDSSTIFDGKVYTSESLRSDEIEFERTQSWVEGDIEALSYPDYNNSENSFGFTDLNLIQIHKPQYEKTRELVIDNFNNTDVVLCKKNKRKNTETRKVKNEKNCTTRYRVSKTRMSRKKSISKNLFKNSSRKLVKKECRNHELRVKKTKKRNYIRYTKPIPKSLIESCHPEMRVCNSSENIFFSNLQNNSFVEKPMYSIAETEKTFFVDIITDDYRETIALRRTVGTDANDEQELLLKSISGHSLYNISGKDAIITENVYSQTIFLNDINEPSTSKGTRHNKTNAQCGSDDMQYDCFLSTATSFHRPAKTISSYNIRELCLKSSDSGTCKSYEYNFNKYVITPTKTLIGGICIKDSDTNTSYNNNISSTSENKNTKTENMYDRNSFSHDDKIYRGCNNRGDVNNDTNYIQNKPYLEKRRSVFCVTNYDLDFIDVSYRSNIQNSHTNIKDVNFISTIQENRQVRTKAKSVGIHVKNLDINFNKIEHSTITDDIRNDSEETKFLKPTLNDQNTLHSTSDFNLSLVSKTALSQTALCRHSSHVGLQLFASKEIHSGGINKFTPSKLCFRGILVHSYKDKIVSEDVVYQGEWQSCIPKVVTKKKPHYRPLSKKVVESKLIKKNINPKEKISSKTTTIKEIQPTSAKVQPTPCIMARKQRLDIPIVKKVNSSNENSAVFMSVPKIIKPFRSVTKVASKIPMRTITSKTKVTYQSKIPTLSVSYKREGAILQNLLNKNYIPPYLKRNLEKIRQSKLNNMTPKLDIVGTSIKMNNNFRVSSQKSLVCRKTKHIRKQLLNIDNLPRENISYLIFRNELEDNEKNLVVHPKAGTNNNKKNENSFNKSSSQNSSTCSSPNSIATVRQSGKCAKISQKSSDISPKCSTGTSGSENKNKTIFKRARNKSKSIGNEFKNKENSPQFIGKSNNDTEKKNITGRNNSIFIAQFKMDSLSKNNSFSKHKTPSKKSNIRVPVADSSHTLLKSTMDVQELSTTRNKSSTSHFVSADNDKEKVLYNSDMNLIYETQQTNINVSALEDVKIDLLDNTFLNNNVTSFNENKIEIQSSIVTTVHQLLEELIDFIVSVFDFDDSFDSETIILSREDLIQSPDDSILSSYKTAVFAENNINTTTESDLGNALNRTFDSILGDESTISFSDTRLSFPDNLDMISFKSIATVSKYSDYLLSNKELNNSKVSHQVAGHDIFEHNDQFIIQKPPGLLALQMHSGFSLNAEAIARVKPDPISLIDSETGNIDVKIPRKVTSEEHSESGRSSDSYESCLLDEDSVVPNWLFNIISQQHPVDEEEGAIELVVPEAPVILPRGISDPMLDTNNNFLEPVLGLGAGDGRGMHSDEHSQNSSGRGTSFSSTETSSGQQSEYVLIDPFTGQIEQLRESVDSAIASNSNFTDTAETPNISTEINEDANASTASYQQPNLHLPSPILATSDIDADISSLDTDIPESSDY